MTQEILIELEVNKQEADYIIAGMAECRYKDVYVPISRLKQQKADVSTESSMVVLTLDQAQKTLDVVLDRPFREVYKLIGKINDQVKNKLDDNSVNSQIVEKENISVFEVEEQSMLEVTVSENNNEETFEIIDSSSIGKPLPKHNDLLEKLASHKRSMA